MEYISANPTGPLVVGSGRNAVLGDTLANVLAMAGYEVQREYYINDVGTQVDNMGKAMYARYAQALGQAAPEPEEYQGEYLVEMGRAAAQAFGNKYLHSDQAEVLPFMRRYALDNIIAGVKEDAALIGVRFDRWFSEQSLYDEGTYGLAFNKLSGRNMTVERDGAVWLKSEDENDKENVIIRSDAGRLILLRISPMSGISWLAAALTGLSTFGAPTIMAMSTGSKMRPGPGLRPAKSHHYPLPVGNHHPRWCAGSAEQARRGFYHRA